MFTSYPSWVQFNLQLFTQIALDLLRSKRYVKSFTLATYVLLGNQLNGQLYLNLNMKHTC